MIRKSDHYKNIEDFISSQYSSDYYEKWIEKLYELENEIGFIGTHNVNFVRGDGEDIKNLFVEPVRVLFFTLWIGFYIPKTRVLRDIHLSIESFPPIFVFLVQALYQN